MRKALLALKDRINGQLQQADILSISDNEDIAAKYSEVGDCLQNAIEALEYALEALE